jgi:hypothetical protein
MKKNVTFLKKLAFIALLSCSSIAIFAADLVEISTEAELRQYFEGKPDGTGITGNYKLTQDITLTAPWTASWRLDADATLDGDNHVIHGLNTGKGLNGIAGFFIYLRGTIKNLGFEDATVNSDGTSTGVIVGLVRAGSIENCYVRNSSVNSTGSQTGIIAGSMTGGSIENCYAENSTVYGHGDTGGLVGRLDGGDASVKRSYTANTVVNGGDPVGGIVGRIIGDNTVVENCYSSARVHARNWQGGGIVGQNTNSGTGVRVSNCYFSGILTRPGTNRASGILGLIENDGVTVENCVNLAALVKSDEIRRIASFNGKSGTYTNNYALSTLTYTTGNTGATEENGADVSAETAKTQAFYETTLGWDFNNVWQMTDGYPVLKGQATPVTAIAKESLATGLELIEGNQIDLSAIYYSGNGLPLQFTSDNSKLSITGSTVSVVGEVSVPEQALISVSAGASFAPETISLTVLPLVFKLAAAGDLDLITQYPSANFELEADIDASEVVSAGLCSDSNPFTGTLDGKGFVVSGLNFEDTGTSEVGFIRKASGATIRNVGITNARFIGNGDVGGIAGWASNTTISGCFVTASHIEADDRAASIAGRLENGATIRDCYATADVKARSHQVGGLVGATVDGGGNVYNSYFAGTTQGNVNRNGGIVGLLDRDATIEIQNNVNLASAMTGGEHLRRITDQNGRGTLSNNYSIPVDGINEGTATDGNGATVTTLQAKMLSFYSGLLGWDFDDVWTMGNGAYPLPVLSVFPSATQPAISPAHLAWEEAPAFIEKTQQDQVTELFPLLKIDDEILLGDANSNGVFTLSGLYREQAAGDKIKLYFETAASSATLPASTLTIAIDDEEPIWSENIRDEKTDGEWYGHEVEINGGTTSSLLRFTGSVEGSDKLTAFSIRKLIVYQSPEDFVIEADALAVYNSDDYANTIAFENITFLSDETNTAQLQGLPEAGLSIRGNLNLKKTFTPSQWYPIGLPFDLSDIAADLSDGPESLLNAGIIDAFQVKSYGNGFTYTSSISENTGYLFQFPANFNEVEVTFVSETAPAWVKADFVKPGDDAYHLLVNPWPENITFPAADNCYKYNAGTNEFERYDGDESIIIHPFESFIIAGTSVLEPLPSITGTVTGLHPVQTINGPVIETRYYTLQGVEVKQPKQREIYLVKRLYESKHTEVTKVLFK